MGLMRTSPPIDSSTASGSGYPKTSMPESKWIVSSARWPAKRSTPWAKPFEPLFGQTKSLRVLDRFLLRGQGAADAEWSLMASTHNILKLFRASLAVN